MTPAQEVLGALSSYDGNGRCPVCDGLVIEIRSWTGVLTSHADDAPGYGDTYLCTVCNVTWPTHRAFFATVAERDRF